MTPWDGLDPVIVRHMACCLAIGPTKLLYMYMSLRSIHVGLMSSLGEHPEDYPFRVATVTVYVTISRVAALVRTSKVFWSGLKSYWIYVWTVTWTSFVEQVNVITTTGIRESIAL